MKPMPNRRRIVAGASSPRVAPQDYPALGYLGIAGEGSGSPTDYQRAGRVDARLIADVAAWIRER